VPKKGKAAMPKGKPPLVPAEIDLVRRWIAEGAKDDTPRTAIDTISEKNPPAYKLPPVITSLDYSPDGSLLAVSGYHEVLLHKSDGSELVARLVGLAERIQSVAFSPDGKSLAVAGGSPGRFGEVQVWDVAKKKLRYSVSVTYDTLYGVSWSPDSSKIAFGCADNSIRAIDAGSGKQILFQGAHADWVLGTVFSQDGEHVVSISRDMSMKLTEVKTQRFVDNVTSITPGALKGGLLALDRRHQPKPTKVKGVDGQERLYDEVIMGGSDGTPRLYKIHRVVQRVIGDDANKVREYARMPGRIFALRFNKDGSLFAAGSSLDGKGELRIYQTGDAKLVSKIDNLAAIYTIAFRPDGKQVASAGFDGSVVLSDPASGKVIKRFVPVPLGTKVAAR
jgi:WD40 repeat protein